MTGTTKEIATAMLALIDAPRGTVRIERRLTPQGPELVVLLAPGIRIPRERMPSEFLGRTIHYKTRKPVTPFRQRA